MNSSYDFKIASMFCLECAREVFKRCFLILNVIIQAKLCRVTGNMGKRGYLTSLYTCPSTNLTAGSIPGTPIA
jgi:hypothetical protein